MSAPREVPRYSADRHAVVLFDGDCTLCNRWVRFVIDRDPAEHFLFARLGSATAARLLGPETAARAGRATLLLVEHGRVYDRSTAVLRIAERLTGGVRWTRVLRVVPRALRDTVYGSVARSRYALFGRTTACSVGSPRALTRLLEE